jgi:hypothetical protein
LANVFGSGFRSCIVFVVTAIRKRIVLLWGTIISPPRLVLFSLFIVITVEIVD